MYEISLVPEVKAELIKKQKTRNLVSLICVVVGVVCGVVLVGMISTTITQSALIESKKNLMACYSDGSGNNCNNTGTPVYKFDNLTNILTMKDQMEAIKTIGSKRIKMSRLLPVLDALLPSNQDGSYLIEEATIDFKSMNLFLDVLTYDGFAYTMQESFRKNAVMVYYDYGSYMREDSDGNYVEIPSFCIREFAGDGENGGEVGYLYGEYLKGEPGCEAPMVQKENQESEDEIKEESENNKETTEKSKTESSETEKEKNKSSEKNEQKEDENKEDERIIIRRTYDNQSDLEAYKLGNDPKAKETDVKRKGYFFDSKCLQYDSKGEFDEEATLGTCKLLTTGDGGEEVLIPEAKYGENEAGVKVLSFKASVVITPEVFSASNKHIIINSPSRRNVTDSYEQVRPIFTKREKIVNEESYK